MFDNLGYNSQASTHTLRTFSQIILRVNHDEPLDGKWLSFSPIELPQADLMLVGNFR